MYKLKQMELKPGSNRSCRPCLTFDLMTLMKAGQILLVPSVKKKKRLLFISLGSVVHFHLLDLLL